MGEKAEIEINEEDFVSNGNPFAPGILGVDGSPQSDITEQIRCSPDKSEQFPLGICCGDAPMCGGIFLDDF